MWPRLIKWTPKTQIFKRVNVAKISKKDQKNKYSLFCISCIDNFNVPSCLTHCQKKLHMLLLPSQCPYIITFLIKNVSQNW